MMRFVLVIIFILCLNSSFSKSFKFSSVKQLSDSIITKNDSTDDLNIFKIYKWITENIYYDCEEAKSNDEIYQKNLIRLSQKKKLLEYNISNTLETINNKSGICTEYANLFKELCSVNNINCYLFDGYAKSGKKQIGSFFRSNHAWNAIKINDTTYYYDCTWGSGYSDEDCKKSFHRPNMNYYRVSDSVFNFSHLVKPIRIDTNFNKKRIVFNNYPFISNGFYESKLYDFFPKEGVLIVRKDSLLTFKVCSNEYIAVAECVLYDTKGKKIKDQKSQVILPEFKDGCYEFKFNTRKIGFFYLVLFYNAKPAFTYKLRVS